MAPAPKTPNSLKFLFGGTAGVLATLIVHPMDVVKTRMQVSGAGTVKKELPSTFEVLKSIITTEGPKGIYSGLGAGLLRQALYTTTRLGIYTNLIEQYMVRHDNKKPTVPASMLFALIGGGIGAFVGTPADVCLVRMAADGKLPPKERRNYKNVVNALYRISNEEGVLALWRGVNATIGRAMVINVAQLASYSHIKDLFNSKLHMSEGLGLHVASSMLSGLIMAVVGMPLDMAKTRLQNQKTDEYKGIVDVMLKVSRKEGVFALWKGFTPFFWRVGPNTVFTLVILEQIYRCYYKYILKIDGDSNL